MAHRADWRVAPFTLACVIRMGGLNCGVVAFALSQSWWAQIVSAIYMHQLDSLTATSGNGLFSDT